MSLPSANAIISTIIQQDCEIVSLVSKSELTACFFCTIYTRVLNYRFCTESWDLAVAACKKDIVSMADTDKHQPSVKKVFGTDTQSFADDVGGGEANFQSNKNNKLADEALSALLN